LKISGVKTYFQIAALLEFVSHCFGFSKNFSTIKFFFPASVDSKIQ
jgi:hypothetical protein